MLRSSPPPSLSPPPATQTTQEQESKPESNATQDTKDPLGEPDRDRSEEGGADSDALAEPFPGFKYQEVLEKPFLVEQRRDVEFQERMNQMILDLVLNFHAWSTARPEFETAHAGDTLMDEAQRVLATEREQGTSLFSFEQNRLRLLEFIQRIKTALASLTGFLL